MRRTEIVQAKGVLLVAAATSIAITQGLLIAQGSQSRYSIVISRTASPSERHAAEELRDFLKEISGAELPILTDEAALSEREIILGDNAHLRELGVEVGWEDLGNEGCVINTVGSHLIIAGGKLRGTMYGVYAFLEEHLGCRWFSSTASRIPRRDRVEIGEIDERQVPVLEYREPFYTDAFDADWPARNRMNSANAHLDEARGGKVTYSHFVHTFYQLVPPEEHFAEHPEYFSEIGGKRTAERAQLCVTNPEVVRIATEKVRGWVREAPEANIFSVSQNDWGGWCECENCRELDEREGSHSATILHFVNQIAEAIEKDYPGKAIDTLAYQYGRKPPWTIRPRKNVIVRLCSIECCFSHPLESCEENRSFREDIEAWSKVADRLYVWDYVTNFGHYIMPFPNLEVLQANIRFFVRHNVKGIFEEGNYSPGGGGEFAELRAYLLAKLLWEPDCDLAAARREFLGGYYGAAAGPIGQYIDLLHEKVRAENIHVRIYDPPTSAYLTGDVLQRAEELFDRAEALADSPDVLERVKVARLPVQYVRIATSAPDSPKREQLVKHFLGVARQAGMTHINEWTKLDDWPVLARGQR